MSTMNLTVTKKLEEAMLHATSYPEWREAAIAHDNKAGLDAWKQTDESDHFDILG